MPPQPYGSPTYYQQPYPPYTGPNYYPQPYQQPNTNPNYYPQPVPAIPVKKHTARNIVLAVIAACLLISGITIPLILHNSTPVQLSTDQIHATATANAIAKYPSYLPGHGNLAMYDTLQHADNWNDGTTGHCLFADNAYHVRSLTTTDEYNCFAQPDNDALNNATNSAFEVQMTITQGDCGGIDLRVSPSAFTDHHKFYFVSLCQDGYYGIFKYNVSHQGIDTVREYAYSTTIKQGTNQTNTIDAVAMGSTLTVFINAQQVASVQDTSITQGTFGLAVSPGRDHISEAVYRNAKIWTF
jgi:hypothetical protein